MAFGELPRVYVLVGVVSRLFLRSLQLVLALAVAGLYGTDINNARRNNVAGDRRWIYAVVVAGISALTSAAYMIPFVKSFLFCVWDLILFVLWVAVFGIFGRLYINMDVEDDADVQRMKNAVWVNLVNMLLWFVSAAVGAYVLQSRRENPGRFRRTMVV